MKIEKEWITEAGYPAKVVAQNMGHRCGYVIIPKDHPYYNKECGEIDIDVHGGLTYSNETTFGFDCAHFGDAKDESIMSEKYKKLYADFPPLFNEGTVKTLEFCIAECEHMAKQFKDVA